KKNNPQLLNSIEDFKLNDKYGGSNKINYDSIGEISPTTLRYINVLSNLISLGIDLNNKNIIEIGIGYGGQCLILSKYFKFKSYTLVDLIEPLLLSKKYLELNNVCNVKYNEMSDLKDNTQYDFVISNYAFSECCKEIQDIYIDKIIKNSKKGYMTLNFVSDVYKIESYNKNDILKIINNSYYIEEEPNSFGNNMVLLWNKTYSQAGQDLFVSSLLDNGFFIDIGCGLPDNINNTLLLEENDWNGISIDNNEYYEKMWNRNTPFILDDANICNFNDILKKYNAPEIIDYLSLDINGYDGLRFSVLEKFFETNKEVKVITIAHDSYVGYKEKENQRKFLTNLGYYLLCTDVLLNNYAFEDWWINPKYFNENEYIFYKSNNIEYSNILGKKKLKEKIKISVLTLTYQRYEFLEEAIQSYLCQDFEGESEMVVINDSPDVEYVYDHPNIRIINCKERFKLISEKLEFGYKQCKYDYVYRLDDDDLLTPWALSVAYKHISKNIGYDIYRSDKHYFFYNNKFKQISSNINNGNIYTKEYLNRIKFPNDFGEDVEITFGNNSNINIINNDKYTMIYRWGTDTYHASIIVFGRSEYNNEKLLNIDNYIKNKENGIINLQPKFRNDYYLQINENI
ncbi:putative sugar O-methyltransferase, partial [Candidatus Dojkabacteria bacterium]|nr:putative sugar O-methyltransferase [Candidatus Dojkabacteria bacterium]